MGPRLIPVLLIKNNSLYKSIMFDNYQYIGDPVNSIKIFNEKEVDEIIVIDIDASRNGRINFSLIEDMASEAFMPFTYGGGIKNVDQAIILSQLGVEKIALNCSLLNESILANEISKVLGSSSVVAVVDVKTNIFGKIRIFNHVTRKKINIELSEYLMRLEKSGVGEIVVQSVDNDGKMLGPNYKIMDYISTNCQLNIPINYIGGIRSLEDAVIVWNKGFSAVLAGSWFVYRMPHRAVLINYPEYKKIKGAYDSIDNKM